MSRSMRYEPPRTVLAADPALLTLLMLTQPLAFLSEIFMRGHLIGLDLSWGPSSFFALSYEKKTNVICLKINGLILSLS